ncbi:unnamed protein product [Allacma fusca]|uniref:Receptor protein-tyrosine kinase n=1 Tax=Allacma fusca TaxID=39272 RepID=A0A8J2LC83_9HEXA|nr:unnamed protein product [Allacma fusca]
MSVLVKWRRKVRVERQGGAWCPKNQITSDAEEWLQIDLHTVHVISATETQGRFGNGQGQEFAETYVISYWRPELGKWVRYRDYTGNEILTGNINTYLASKTELKPPIVASKLRFLPYSYHRRTVCMRAEIYGCPFRGGLLSYTMPQGSKRGENWNFYDHTYDGFWDGNYLRNGLGQLIDGRGGPDNFKDDYYGHERGKGWVGWKNDTKNGTSPVEIVFKFDSVREFNAVHIHASNQFVKDVQVFSEARIYFSVGGKIYPGDPITYTPMEDRIFEEPKNVTIKLHHRFGQYVKIQLFWAAKWILISEVTFDSQPAMGNFSDELVPSEDVLAQSDASEGFSGNRLAEETPNTVGQTPTATSDWSSTTIVITAVISSFVAIIVVLLIILVALVFRNKLRARNKAPVSQHGTLPFDNQTEFDYVSPEEIRKCKISTGEYQEPFTTPPLTSFPGAHNLAAKGKMAEYYSCTLVSNPAPLNNADSCNEYEYAVPNELGKLLPNQLSPLKSIPNSPAVSRNRAIQMRFRELGVVEIPKHRLRMLRKLGDGAFGTVYIGEMESNMSDKSLVAVKHLLRNATEKDKSDFLEEVRLLSSLSDVNVAQVLGVCTEEEPYCVILEFLELGDLCQFLRQNDTLLPNATKKLSFGSLLYLASQIASGMRFLESRNIVHRDLATRNCVVGRDLVVKISHFATDTDLYSTDYYRLDGKMPLPIRWMAWESLFLGKYSTKSDVWSFGVTLWEILSFSRHSPYPTMSNQEVLNNLRRLSIFNDADPFEPLAKPHGCSRDIYQLMCDTWRRNDEDRPTFWEIHSFLTRKNLNYAPPPPPMPVAPILSSSASEHYIV